MSSQSASYTKLRDGSWGIRVLRIAPPVAGDQITVTTKAGVSKVETISSILWTGPDKYTAGLTCSLVRDHPVAPHAHA